MINRPKYPNRFNESVDRLKTFVKCNIPMILVSECWITLKRYYGSAPRAFFFLLKNELWMQWMFLKTDAVIWISDRVGWTKLYHVPETAETIEHWQRHGYRCSGSPNCGDIDCIQKSIPTWFKILTRWHV